MHLTISWEHYPKEMFLTRLENFVVICFVFTSIPFISVVKWMVKHVCQFPSDAELTRYIATVSDKDLLKKCHTCMEIIRVAKEKQAAEAAKNASSLLEELDREKNMEESKKAAAARKREKKKRKKMEKLAEKGLLPTGTYIVLKSHYKYVETLILPAITLKIVSFHDLSFRATCAGHRLLGQRNKHL